MNTSNALFTTPFNHNTDFIDLADNCERFCEALVEETDPARKMALCGRLATSLALLRPMLLEPVPEYLQERLTVDVFPDHAPAFTTESDQLNRYCEEITQLLISGALAPESARVMGDLLFELTRYFADLLKAPRWLRTEAGVALLG
ncbi:MULTISPECIES: hypothetical protein [Enterobacter]|uniref:hypothetical protein n=1 Tax=Enterobacter TaxID=547 RepID=UPI0015E91924|nr:MULTISPECIES: hypothetical protein [Enterobacter]QMR74839.1 hypothetical protein HV107_04065 [Enterobacter sp. RHBSTW-00175]WNT38825.1 hypothetical protein RRL13_17415 [Enterobacter cloacae]HDR2792765.1 hypothetical protein [Enterobacter asburiae]HDR2799780.1 hypothetical protein [Enterobacter asburiae]